MGGSMGMALPLIAATAIGMVAGGGAMAIGDRVDRGAVEEIVRSYILEHPEIIPEAMKRLQTRETAQLIDGQRAAIEKPFGAAWAGNGAGDVTVTMFTDYSCGYCRASLADVDRLIAADKGVRVVWREIPILGPASEKAARVALASAKRGAYLDTHRALFANRDAAPAPKPADPEIEAEIDNNLALARSIGLTGTPTFIIGDQILQGAVGYRALADAVAVARKKG